MPWYVLYTKPRAEKKAAERLEEMGVTVYCPLIKTVRQWSDRKKKVDIPLFKSYLFVHLEDRERNIVFHVDGIVRYLFWLGKPAIVRDEEIETIREWLDEKDVTGVEVTDISKGDTVRVESGLFKDERAYVEDVQRQYIYIVLESLGWRVKLYYRDAKRVND